MENIINVFEGGVQVLQVILYDYPSLSTVKTLTTSRLVLPGIINQKLRGWELTLYTSGNYNLRYLRCLHEHFVVSAHVTQYVLLYDRLLNSNG